MAVGATARPDAHGDVRLLAYVVGSTDQVVEPVALRAALARRLPRSMLPDRIMVLADLPRLPGGKIDRATLPDTNHLVPSGPATRISASAASSTGTGPDPTEVRLTRIFARALGLSADAVTADADFFDLGGDSLRTVLDIESQFAVDLPVSVLIEAPTIAALAPLVRAGTAGDPWSCVLPVQIDGDRPPLFVVHDGVGSVMGARPLADQLGSNQPVYAIRQRELSGVVDPGETIEAVVEGYVTEIRRVVPHGPYLIFGHSFGGSSATRSLANCNASA